MKEYALSSLPFSLLVLVLFITVVSSHKTPAYNHETTSLIDNSKWMASIKNETFLLDLSLPGTHETLSINYGGGIAKCQSLSLETQLRAGIRVVDIRCRHVDNKFAIHHGIEFQHIWFNEVLQILQKFLQSNPSEFILMRVKEEYEASNNSRSFEATYESYWEDYKSVLWSPTTQKPKVKDIRGKIVVLDNFSGTNSYGLNYGSRQFEIQDDFRFYSNWDLYSKWEKVRSMLIKADGSRYVGSEEIFINYLSGSYGSFPFFVASGHVTASTGSRRLATGFVDPIEKNKYPDFPRVNCFLRMCTIAFEGTNVLTYNLLKNVKTLRYVGILMVDFPGDGLIQAIIDLNKKHLSMKPIWTEWSIALLVAAAFTTLCLLVVVFLSLVKQSCWRKESSDLKQQSAKKSVLPYERFH